MTEPNGKSSVGRDPNDTSIGETLDSEEREFFIIGLQGIAFAFESTTVEHVAAALDVLRVPTAPRYIVGLVHTRQSIVPVVDLIMVLDLEHNENPSKDPERINQRFITFNVHGQKFAIIADQVLDLCNVRMDTIKSIDRDAASSGPAGDIFVGQYENRGNVVTVVSAAALLGRLTNSVAEQSVAYTGLSVLPGATV